MLSYQDAINTAYGFERSGKDADRQKSCTDYAKSQGICVITDEDSRYYGMDSSYWWLRSPNRYVSLTVWCVGMEGDFGGNVEGHTSQVDATYHGVCPAVWIKM